MEEQQVEVLAELEDVPTGKLGLKKRLTVSEYAGNMIYHIFEYAPRPWVNNPETYVPARGIDLTEDELMEICKILRVQLYDRLYDETDSDEAFQMDIGITDKEKSDNEPFENDLVLDFTPGEENYVDLTGPEFYHEIPDLDCVAIEEYIEFPSGIKCCLMRWHDGPTVYDIREWKPRINSKGNWESFPEIDKGISLEDYEAELLCRAIERLFPEVSQFTCEYRIPNWSEKMESFHVHLSPSERRLALGTLEINFRATFMSNSSRNSRGSAIGRDIGYARFMKMGDLSRKFRNGERFTDEEILLCASLFETAADNFREGSLSKLTGEAYHGMTDVQVTEGLTALYKRLDNIVKKRGRLSANSNWISKVKRIDASNGEFNVASEVLQLMENTIYDDTVKSPEIKVLRKTIDKLVKNELEVRNKEHGLDSKYKENPGKNFLDDFIVAFLSTGQF